MEDMSYLTVEEPSGFRSRCHSPSNLDSRYKLNESLIFTPADYKDHYVQVICEIFI